jgi:hypothetical protein
MKKIVKLTIVLLSALGLGLLGCTKNLETTPDTSLTELKTFEDARSALLGTYDGFQSNNYYNSPAASGSSSSFSTLPDLMGDDFVEAIESLGNWNIMSEMIYAADYGNIATTFIQPYEIISRANNLLQSLGKYESGSTAAEAKRIRAQALAIRAHCHFDLMRYFAQSYERNSTALGVAYVTTFDPQKPFASLPTRSTVKDNYDAVLKDLSDALVMFREGGNTTGNASRFFIDSVVVYAMRARVNYYAAQWNDVIRDASTALNRRPLGNAADFVRSFAATDEAAPPSEVYWQIPSDNTLRPGGAISGNSSNYRITQAMGAILTAQGGAYVDPGVVRFNQASSSGFRRTSLWKYSGVRSFKVFRAGEMILMRAEAKARLNDPTALADLNELRTARGVAIGTETGASLLNAILLQRRVELLGEGHRWFDLRRTTRTIVRGECGTASSTRAERCTINADARGWVFPIPFNELKVNPNLVQNPGY